MEQRMLIVSEICRDFMGQKRVSDLTTLVNQTTPFKKINRSVKWQETTLLLGTHCVVSPVKDINNGMCFNDQESNFVY